METKNSIKFVNRNQEEGEEVALKMPLSNKVTEKKSKHPTTESFFHKKLASIRSSFVSFFNSTLRKPTDEHENDLVNINLRAQDIFVIDNNSNFIKTTQLGNDKRQQINQLTKENSLCKLPIKLNNTDYYDYEDIFTYFKTNAVSGTSFNARSSSDAAIISRSNRFMHILYDIPEEETDYEEDDDEDDDMDDYNCNFDEILKI